MSSYLGRENTALRCGGPEAVAFSISIGRGPKKYKIQVCYKAGLAREARPMEGPDWRERRVRWRRPAWREWRGRRSRRRPWCVEELPVGVAGSSVHEG
uniref:Uncharacterized protein n=1 Tax=Oryza barthii TaxID=65489 RepID=A0A0D3F0W2_9ORYZ